MKYNEQLLTLFHHPVHAGELADALVLSAGQQEHGDAVKLYLQVNEQQVTKASFKAYGSVVTLAMAEYTCQWLTGKTLVEAKTLTGEMLLNHLKLPTTYVHKAQLFIEAIQQL